VSASIIPPLKKLKRAHTGLMGGYVRALGSVAELPWVSRRNGLRTFVSFYIEGHIRKQLRRIASAYVALEQALDASADDPRRAWLRDAREQTERQISVLKHVGVTLAVLSPAAIIPVVATLKGLDLGQIARWFGVHATLDKHARVVAIVLGVTAMAYAVFYFSVFAAIAFRAKRRVFYADAPGVERLWKRVHDTGQSPNIYRLEDVLFELLPARKRREGRADLVFQLLVGVAVFAGCVWVAQRAEAFPLFLWMELAAIALFGVALAVNAIVRFFRRRDR